MSRIARNVAVVLIGSLALAADLAAGVKGEFLEAHTRNLWASAASCSACETTSHQAVLAWKVTQGAVGDASLDGMVIVAIVFADRPLSDQQAKTRVHLLVDSRANAAQQEALVQLATSLAPTSIQGHVAAVTPMAIRMKICCGCAAGYADLNVGPIHVKTRRVNDDDRLRFGEEKREYSILGDSFYKYPAFTEEFAYSGGDEKCQPFVLKDLCSAAVGGFAR